MGNELVKIVSKVPDLLNPEYELPEGIPLEDVGRMIQSAYAVDKLVQWALGRLWVYAEDHYGAREYGAGVRLAEWFGVNYQTMRNCARVWRQIPIARRRYKVLSFGHHEAVAALPAPQQDEWLKRAEADELSVMKLRAAIKHEAKKETREQRVKDLAAATVAASKALNRKVYGVIYADPPWPWKAWSENGMDSAPENHYPTMTLDQIKALLIPAHDDCALFLWTTGPLLEEAFGVINAWGFKYKANVAWKKAKAGTGYWYRNRHELLLTATKGKIAAPAPGEQWESVFESLEYMGHSVKPDEVAGMIESYFPDVPKLEMFAREMRHGWDYHGNEGGYGVVVTPEQPPAAPEAAPERQGGAPVGDNAEALLVKQLEKQHKRYRMNRAFRYRAGQVAKRLKQ